MILISMSGATRPPRALAPLASRFGPSGINSV
jgi:hypothetical protein